MSPFRSVSVLGGAMPGELKRGTPQDFYDEWSVRIRDLLLYLVGVAGIVNEIWLEEEPRWSILVFVASLVGLPTVLKLDEVRSHRDRNGKSGS
jgi:hypothetical protein